MMVSGQILKVGQLQVGNLREGDWFSETKEGVNVTALMATRTRWMQPVDIQI
jgi:hypothetical protein